MSLVFKMAVYISGSSVLNEKHLSSESPAEDLVRNCSLVVLGQPVHDFPLFVLIAVPIFFLRDPENRLPAVPEFTGHTLVMIYLVIINLQIYDDVLGLHFVMFQFLARMFLVVCIFLLER